jgi:UDP-N-acetylmuramoyl-L-alanyl-D-glutamate--2,6-diaminopimelate ligase
LKKLQDILYGVSIESIVGSTSVLINSVEFDSRRIQKEALFIAQKGVLSDGHDFISNAIDRGAKAILCEVLPEECKKGIVYVRVSKDTGALGIVASNFYDNPSKKLSLV